MLLNGTSMEAAEGDAAALMPVCSARDLVVLPPVSYPVIVVPNASAGV